MVEDVSDQFRKSLAASIFGDVPGPIGHNVLEIMHIGYPHAVFEKMEQGFVVWGVTTVDKFPVVLRQHLV